MKTYSVAIKNQHGQWITNWNQYAKETDINWMEVKQFADNRGDLAYGYYYGHNSRNLCSARTRTVLYEKE